MQVVSSRTSTVSFFMSFLLSVWVVLIAPASGSAQLSFELSLSPIRSDFLSFYQNRESPTVRLQAFPENELGLIPSPLDLSHLKSQRAYQLLGLLPAGYDLRTQGKLTPPRDQGGCGSCWSFAAYGSLESNLKPSETWDFSENNLKNTHGFDMDPCEGGNADIATAYLVRWKGPVPESEDPYDPDSGVSPSGLAASKHVQEVLILPDRSDFSDNDGIKQAIMTYGAVYTEMYYHGDYYHSTRHTYYFSGSHSSNHGVAIVGWDDNFDKNNFLSSPPGNGAFIIKNSWGTSWGEDGYFYISYYDRNIGEGNYVFNIAEGISNYSHPYQYDPLGWTASLGYGSSTGWFANIFTAVSDDPITAISFYTASLNSSYEITLYTNITSSPRSGYLSGSKTGTISSPGYHTVPFGFSVPLISGQKFSVVVKLTTPGFNFPIPIEYPFPNYSSQATALSGESYVSGDGTSWSDVTTNGFPGTNVCLKAFSEGTSPFHQNITSLVEKYYNDTLGRTPEPGGAEFWTSEVERIVSLGIDIKEGFEGLAKFFFTSPEYLQKDKTDNAFITDLYQTFLNRAPDSMGFAFWQDQLNQGLTRNMLITQFTYSQEFGVYLQGILGSLSVKPENNLVNDFYRGLLNRFPDTTGFNGWLNLMKNAQCMGDQAVRDVSYQIASEFVRSLEYELRSRNNSEYVEDLYNGILRRGADPLGFTHWFYLLDSETYSHEQMLQSFVDSQESQLRVQEVIDAGCAQ